MGAEHSSLRGHGNHEHESKLRSQDNPHSDAHQPHGHKTGEAHSQKGVYGMTGLVGHDHGEGCCKAQHHPAPSREPHKMSFGRTEGAHGFGHGSRRDGHLRLSGHSGAHRIGSRHK